MRASKNIDLEVRIGVLEKLVDRLFMQVENAVALSKQAMQAAEVSKESGADLFDYDTDKLLHGVMDDKERAKLNEALEEDKLKSELGVL